MEKKKGIVLYIIIAFTLVGVFLLFLFWPNLKGEQEKTIFYWNEHKTAEVYSEVKISDFVTIEQGVLEDKQIDTSELGEITISFNYHNDRKKKKTKSFKLLVLDTTPPLIWISNSYTVQRGTKNRLEDTVLCGDNYDKKPRCWIEGEYDLDKIGEYPLTYLAIDSSGNQTREEFKLRVIEKFSNSQSSKLQLEEIKTKYSSLDTSIGIDVSRWQEKIDWKKVKDSGVEFAMIRVGTQIGPKEGSKLDAYFLENIKGAKEVGIKVGVYYYSYASSKKEAREQAKWVMQQIEDYPLDLPVVFDWECYTLFNSLGISLYDLNKIADTFLNMMEKFGYQPMIYGSKNYLEKIWTNLDYDVWLAHYTENTDYRGEYLMWQLTNNGKVPGIQSAVDIDIFYKGKN